jgi:hypothetical protein
MRAAVCSTALLCVPEPDSGASMDIIRANPVSPVGSFDEAIGAQQY